jgi:uncharacterized protein YhaN
MRLIELSLEKYGSYLERTVTIPDEASLTVIYGPNEAGKSTYLEAISDFLFGIPKSSPRGETYGYPSMRIGATMRMANGEVLRFHRRKGNAKTLIDAKGAGHDDTLLTSTVLGAITRQRFGTLFGLNHETLRSGGDDLLHADGDIGRLIVEAGGGLRAMVRRLEAIDKEADDLFAKTRSQSRKFYEALSAYESAEKQARAHLLSRDTYEEARNKAQKAKQTADALRGERVSLSVSISGLERVVRVGPVLRERNDLVLDCAAFADTASYPEDFSTKVHGALKAREDAEKAHREAVERLDKVQGKIDGLSVSRNLSAAEKVIALLSEKTVQVSHARGSRPNRLRDIDLEDAKLHPLRGMLGLSPTANVAEMLPERAAIDRVQSLVAKAFELKPSLTTANERGSEFADALHQIERRIAEDKASGFDRPLGVASSQFGSLVVQKVTLEARQQNAKDETLKIREDLTRLGVSSVEELAALCCPTADEVRAEQTTREKITTACLEQERLKRKADAEIESGLEGIAALEAGGPVATVAAIAEAREFRGALWRPIRASFVEGLIEQSPEARRDAAEAFEGRIEQADVLSDRCADEAKRVASRMEFERGVGRARRNAAEAERELAELGNELTAREEAFASAYPELLKRFPALSALLDFSQRRKDLLDRADEARKEAADIAVEAARLAPVVDLVERMEAKLGLEATDGFAARVEALQAAVTEHDKRHAEYRRGLDAREETAVKLKAARIKLEGLRSEQDEWDKRWPDAIKALASSATTTPTDGNKLATEWAAARGILTTIAEIEKRLARMDDDETDLRRDVSETARELEIDVADDGVAGAQMLEKRWVENESLRVKRDGLKDDYEEARVEAQKLEAALKSADEDLAALASAIWLETSELSAAAARYDSRRDIEVEIADAERRAMDAGDRLPIATLEKEWANRDLDAVRAALEDARARSKQIEEDVERAILKEKEGLDALAAFADESDVNRAIVEREGATARMHAALERYLELALASDLLGEAMAQVRAEQQDPLVACAGALFAAMTEGEFVAIETDVDEKGLPVVKGKRANGESASISTMSDGTRDQLFLAFRLASLENYSASAEPLPFVADDVLVHFDDARAKATLTLLAEFGKRNQVLLFTHHESVRNAAAELAKEGRANIVDLAKAA